MKRNKKYTRKNKIEVGFWIFFCSFFCFTNVLWKTYFLKRILAFCCQRVFAQTARCYQWVAKFLIGFYVWILLGTIFEDVFSALSLCCLSNKNTRKRKDGNHKVSPKHTSSSKWCLSAAVLMLVAINRMSPVMDRCHQGKPRQVQRHQAKSD